MRRWRSPEELAEIGLTRSRVLMVNEAHDGPRRCIRTRHVGTRMIEPAHAAGVRHLAMEALTPAFAAAANRDRCLGPGGGYLAQSDLPMMALNLRTLVTDRPYDYAVVLTGRRHACRKAHRLSIKPRPMAAHLAPDRLYLVRVSFRGGSTWHCPGRGPCGIYDLPDMNDQRPLNRGNQLPPNERRACGFDAEIVLPRATPSPPACRLQSGSS